MTETGFGLAPVKREGGIYFYDTSTRGSYVFPERISLVAALIEARKEILDLLGWDFGSKFIMRSYWERVKELTDPEFICPDCDSSLEIHDCTGDSGYFLNCIKCEFQFGGELNRGGVMTGMYVYPEDLLSKFSELKKKGTLVSGQAWESVTKESN